MEGKKLFNLLQSVSRPPLLLIRERRVSFEGSQGGARKSPDGHLDDTIIFFFYKNVVFPAQAADFRLKIFLYYS